MKRMRGRAFTLVELLVVLTVVATLIALLLPSLNKARETARRLMCLGNQRAMGVGMLNFESEYGRLPNLKLPHGTLQTLEGQPWRNSAPTVNIYADYNGTEEYRILLADFMGAKLGSLQNGKHIYIPRWSAGHSFDCPAAMPNASAADFDDNFAADPNNGNPYPEFYRWGGFQMDIQPIGANIAYWNNNVPGFIKWRRTSSTRISNMREVVLVNEVCRVGTTGRGANNHMGQGLNAVWFDLSGGWIPIEQTVAAGIDTWAGGNRFGDAGVTQARIPSARWAQLGGGFRIQEFGVFYGNGNMNPAYPSQVSQHCAMIAKMGYAPESPY